MTIIGNEIAALEVNMLKFLQLIGNQLEETFSIVFDFDETLADNILLTEKQVDLIDEDITKECERIIALFSPVAGDLRYVLACNKISLNLERISDNSNGIVRYLLDSTDEFDKTILRELHLPEMTEIVAEMMTSLQEAFRTKDANLAIALLKKEEALDEINLSANSVLAAYLCEMDDENDVLHALFLLTIVRKVERIGDYIINIAQEIAYIVEGNVIRNRDWN